jgi:hypothetical protein
MNNAIESKRLLAILKRKRAPKLETIDDVSIYVTKFMLKRYRLSEGDINNGYCFIWAYLVWALMKEPVNFVMDDGHVAILFDGTYYDSDTFGAHDIDSIIRPCDYHDSAIETDVDSMAWYWTRCGTHRKEFRTILKMTCKSIYNYAVGDGFSEDGKNRYDCEELSLGDIP